MKNTAFFREGALTAHLGEFHDRVDAAFSQFETDRTLERIWRCDYRVWRENPTEIVNRMGWLQSSFKMVFHLDEIRAFVETVRAKRYDTAVLLGMGGSSLAPEVFRRIYGVSKHHLDLIVLDSTDPDAVAELRDRIRLLKTLFIVATKSGSTVETLSFMKYFLAFALKEVGSEEAGSHFIAITDPGSRLEKLAAEFGFRKVFLNDPDIGGRYSALSFFGLVPAALIGMDIESILEHTVSMASPEDRTAAYLGVAMGELGLMGRDKLTLLLSRPIEPFGAWVEQLVAESLGKEGKGVLPIVGESVASPAAYGNDRLFVHLRLKQDEDSSFRITALINAGHPVVEIALDGLEALPGEFFRWMMATAVAGARMGINPFDQPNVEAAKKLARKMVLTYQETGKIAQPLPDFETEGIQIFFKPGLNGIRDALQRFFNCIRKGKEGTGYVAIQAYLKPDPRTDQVLQAFRTRIRDRLQVAVTTGYGPRFLHSTGQLHKGDGGYGLFIQLTADSDKDLTIPEEIGRGSSGTVTFGVLKSAQALGDRQALLDSGRIVIRFHLTRDITRGIERLTESI